MTTSRLRVLFCLGAAFLMAACGGGGDRSEQVGTTEQAIVIPPGSNAVYVPAQSNFPASFKPGERRLVTLTMRNTGTTSPANDWNASNPAAVYQLATRDGAWGWAWTAVTGTILPNGLASFSFIVTAPLTLTPAQPFSFQMRIGSSAFFGAQTTLTPSISNAATADWECTLVSSTIPAMMTPGQAFVASITVRNTGSQTWTPAASFALAARDAPVNFWGPVYTYLTAPVAGNGVGTATFSVGITAPTTPGTYTYQREMKSFGTAPLDFRNSGPFCVSKSIIVMGAKQLDAQIVSATFTTPINTGSYGSATVVMKNTGTETWTPGTTYELFSEASPVNLWGVTQVAFTGNTPITTSQNATFSFTFQAPTTAGTYAQKWQMRKLTSDGSYFGDVVNVPITVVAGAANYDAAVVSQTVPTLLTAGKTATFTIQMKNTGSTAWTGSQFQLVSTAQPAVNVWGVVSVNDAAGDNIVTNGTKTFTIPVTAPAAAGTYQSSWRMKLSTGAYFGATALTNVVVTLCGNSVVDAGENCDDGNLTSGDGCSSTCQQEQVAIDSATGGATSRTLIGSGQLAALGAVTLGDVTGDGKPEIFSTEFNPPTGLPTPVRNGGGAVYGMTTGASFLNSTSTTMATGATLRIGGGDASDALGRVLVGEVTGDTIKDLIVSAPGGDGASNGRTNCGEVYVLTGGPSLISAGLIDLRTTPTQQKAHIIGATAGASIAAVGIGDLTGDGQPDLLVAAGGGAGKIYIIPGGSGLTGEIDLSAPPASVKTIVGGTPTDNIGGIVAIGDVNNDTKPDLLVGAALSAPGGRTRAGAAYLRLGPITTNVDFSQAVSAVSTTGPSAKWLGKNNTDQLGQTVAIGNVTGSAVNEVLIGGIQYQRSAGVQSGGVHVWAGVTAGTTYDESAGATPTTTIMGADPHDDCGTALALGDMNHDGFQDIILACSAASGPGNTRTKSGEVNVIFGATSLPATFDLLTTRSRLILYGEAANDLLGRAPTSLSAADIDGDNLADFCAGTTLGGGSIHPGRIDCVMSTF